MNFIRNIISEKRAARPDYAPPAPVDAFPEESERVSGFRQQAEAEVNVFADDPEDFLDLEELDFADEAAFAPPAEPEAAIAAPQPAVAYEPEPFDALDAWPGPAAPPIEPPKAAPLVLSARPAPMPEPASPRTLDDMPFVSAAPLSQAAEIVTDAGLQMPPPAAGRGSNRSGRVKTRLLGFNPENVANPFERAESKANDSFPVGWLVVVAGPGLGAAFSLHDGVSRVGRGEDQTVCLNFGDNSISRENHISLAFDAEQNAFYVGQSGRSNIVRLNNKPLLSTEQVRHGDQIRVGETTLRLVALCGDTFSWAAKS